MPPPAPPRLSVVIPLYNKAGQIARTLDAVLAQTVRDIEVVVVDDGSTDDGAAIVAAHADPRLRLERQPNAGVSAARNRGVALAACPVVAFVDADDTWLPDHLERLWRLRLAFPDAVGWAANYEIVGRDGGRSPGVRPDSGPPVVLTPRNFFRIALQGSPVCSSGVMVDKAALLRVGGFPVGVRLGEDLDTWIRLLFIGAIAFDPRPGARYHADGDDRALMRLAPPARYPFFDTGEAWRRAHPEDVEVGTDIEEFLNFFRVAHAHHQIKWGDRAAGRAVLHTMDTRAFADERRRLLRLSLLPQWAYQGLGRLRLALRRPEPPPAALPRPAETKFSPRRAGHP
ncbi:MAG: glycosyltransferase family 2 protein [Mitsuaria chitosanitabida]|uniref:glycosyltransferase family 2 protein n=1 Tax=Roseateles chitosanitabidus TaxID=65048 RepID=UPI001B0B0699|nr:glycosyltransferase family A protein [Roseateles chitosanitabidus]MBO9689008.1 glycosyltransferase family 2 protein [Roseateles chitosanitabidus]